MREYESRECAENDENLNLCDLFSCDLCGDEIETESCHHSD